MMGRARIIHRKYENFHGDTSVLKWEEAPDAPQDFDCVLDWNDEDWDKSYGGYVLAPAVRDVLFENFGVFALFWTPLFLDESGFRKFCYLVAGDDNLEDCTDGRYERWTFCSTHLPSNYLPFDFRGEPLEWAWQLYQQRERKKRMAYLEDAMEEYCHATGTGNIPADQDMTKQTSLQNEEFAEDDLFIDADGWLIKSNDQVRLVNYTERELNGAIGTVYFHDPQGHRRDHVNVFMPTISEDTAISISIHNLRKFILSGSSSATPDLGLEPLIDWSEMPPERDHVVDEATIRLVDMSSDIKRQISSFLPLFDVEQNLRNVCRDTFWNFRKPPPEHLDYDFIYFYGSNAETAEWHGVAHLTRDVYRALKDHDWHMGEEGGLSLSLMFVKFDRSQPIVPLFKFDNNREPDELLLSEWDPIGVQYCSVKQASHIELEFCPVFVEELDDPSQTKNRDFISILRHCDEWQPRGPRIPLQYFGTRKSDCEYCGKGDAFCRCELSGPGGEHGKDVRIYYSPQWFFSNNSYCYSAPSGSAEPAVVIFQHQAELNRFQI